MRSISEIIFSAEEICLRSRATGMLLQKQLHTQGFYVPFLLIDFILNPQNLCHALFILSTLSSASICLINGDSHRAPILINSIFSCSSCCSNLILNYPKPPGNIVLCFLVIRNRKYLLCLPILNNLSQKEEYCFVRNTGRLLHIVRNHNNSIIFFQSIARSSIFEVEIGSSAEVGSSIRSTSGSTASALAIQRRCCCPPDMPRALNFSRSLSLPPRWRHL